MNVTAQELSKYFDCSNQYISVLHKDEGMPRLDDGKYDLEESVKWYVNYLKNKSVNKKDAEAEAKARQAVAKARLLEIELREKEQALITVDEAIDVFSNSLAALRSRLLALPSRVAPQLYLLQTAAEVEGEMKKFVNEFLLELAAIPDALKNVEHDTESSKEETTTEDKTGV